jgi:ribonuclease P protein component
MLPQVLHYKKIEGSSRVVIVVSKKIDKRATKRNRMRRLIRESLRHLGLADVGGMILVRKNIAEYKQTEVEMAVKHLFHEKAHS